MLQRPFSVIFLAIVLALSACTPEEFQKPVAQKRFSYRFSNLNARVDPIDVRLSTADDVDWLGFDITFEGKEPREGYGSVLVTVDSSQRDSSDVLFFDILDNRSKEPITQGLEFNSEVSDVTDFPASLFLVDSFGKPVLVRTLDDFDDPQDGTAGIRFVNMNYLFVSVSLEVKNDTTVIDRKNFLNSSGFEYVGAGNRTIYLRNDLTQTLIDSIPNLTMKAGRVYSVYFTQKMGNPVIGYEKLR